MRRTLALALFLFLLATVTARAAQHGTWHLSPRDDGRMQIDLISDHNQNSHPIERTAFTGLSAAQIDGADTPADFRLVRDAGTLHFTGTFLHGDGVGRFTFEPNGSYAATLRGLGVASSELDDERLFSLALHDISASFIREMQSLGYHEELDRYIAFRIHGVSPEFIKGMKELGVRDLESDNLVMLRIHGATVDYVRELRDLGYSNLTAGQLVQMRIHGVSPSYIRDLKSAGYANIPVEKLVSMRIHGIDAEFVRKTR